MSDVKPLLQCYTGGFNCLIQLLNNTCVIPDASVSFLQKKINLAGNCRRTVGNLYLVLGTALRSTT